MNRPFRPMRPHDAADAPALVATPEVDGLDAGVASPGEPGLSALPIAGITRRRTATVVAGVLAAWIVIVFARQVGEASAATTRAVDIAAANNGLRGQVASRERELQLIGRQRYIQQQARGYGLGSPHEIPFTLARNAPPLPADAPGSAAVRVGAEAADVTPLERWLTVLFGPSD